MTNDDSMHMDADFDWDDHSWHSEELRSPISSDDEGEGSGKHVFPRFNEATEFGHISLEIGMLFSSLSSFKAAVRDYTIHWGRQIKWVKNDKTRARARCREQECAWEIFCTWSQVNESFQIKTFVSEHTCSRGFKNKQANRKWVVKKLEDKIRSQPSLSHREAFDFLKQEFGVHIDETKIFRAMKKARELVKESERLNTAENWVQTEYLQPAPPQIRRRAGRPKKRRRKDENEEPVSNNRLKRVYPDFTCSRCGLVGHNRKGCLNPGVPKRPKKWTPPEPQTTDTENAQVEIDVSQSGPAPQDATSTYVSSSLLSVNLNKF